MKYNKEFKFKNDNFDKCNVFINFNNLKAWYSEKIKKDKSYVIIDFEGVSSLLNMKKNIKDYLREFNIDLNILPISVSIFFLKKNFENSTSIIHKEILSKISYGLEKNKLKEIVDEFLFEIAKLTRNFDFTIVWAKEFENSIFKYMKKINLIDNNHTLNNVIDLQEVFDRKVNRKEIISKKIRIESNFTNRAKKKKNDLKTFINKINNNVIRIGENGELINDECCKQNKHLISALDSISMLINSSLNDNYRLPNNVNLSHTLLFKNINLLFLNKIKGTNREIKIEKIMKSLKKYNNEDVSNINEIIFHIKKMINDYFKYKK